MKDLNQMARRFISTIIVPAMIVLSAAGCAQHRVSREEAPAHAVLDKTDSVENQTEAARLCSSLDKNKDKEQVLMLPGSAQRRVAYFTSWSAYARSLAVTDLDPSLLTHVNFAFANLNENGEICVGDPWVDVEKTYPGGKWASLVKTGGHFGQLQGMKQFAPNIKILISVGGWTWSGNFSKVASTEDGRRRFAASAASFLDTHGFDGLDIDWEFPVEGGNGIEHRPQDRENYTLLLKEVRSALDELETKTGRACLLTIAGGPNPSFTRNVELASIMQYVDFINVMSYDYHGAWEGTTGHNAPLYARDGLSVSDTIQAYLAAGAKPEQLNLGIPFYGRGWIDVRKDGENGSEKSVNLPGLGQGGTAPAGVGYGLGTWEGAVFDYWDLSQNYENKNGYNRYFDEFAKVPYLYNGNTFISYDDEESLKAKLDYGAQMNLGGIMFWEFGGDKTKQLQRLINSYGAGQSGGDKTSGTDNLPQTQPAGQSQAAAAWNCESVYQGGDRVTYKGYIYRAKWWTQGEAPDQNAQEWGPWAVDGAL